MATATADQRREEARRAYNANLAECPGHELLRVISDKWVTLVVAGLADGPLRHADLARRVAGATQKMLTQTLRKLERDGVISRTVTPSVPARVDYALTNLGRNLLPLQQGIKAWAEAHIEEVHAARMRYDAAASDGHPSE